MRWAPFLAAVCIAAGATAATPPSPQARVLRTSELGGLVVPTRPALVTTAAKGWQGSRPTAGQRRAGFVRGPREALHANAHGGVRGWSFVAEFRTATGARDVLASEVAAPHAPAPTYVAFPVAGIPRAHGFTGTGPGQVAYKVIFSDGRFHYWIGLVSSPAVTLPIRELGVEPHLRQPPDARARPGLAAS